MNDIRVIAAITILVLLIFGLLCAKAFAFSVAWILWPLGILTVCVAVVIAIMSGANVG